MAAFKDLLTDAQENATNQTAEKGNIESSF